jgi:membrane-bound lytic murein transglycosylase B
LSGKKKRLRGAQAGSMLLAGVLVATYGVNAYGVSSQKEPVPPQRPVQLARPSPHRSVDGGLPEHLAPPPVQTTSSPVHQAISGDVPGIPAIVLDADRRAGQREAARDSGCHLPWQLLAGIGKVESNHAEEGAVDPSGTALRPILGPELNGGNGYAAVPNSAPALDGGSQWARAVGPMQFIPSTWDRWATSATANPENVYDATSAAADYLCAGGRDLSTQDGLTEAILSYNNSARYLSVVLQWYQAYGDGAVPTPDQPEPPAAVEVAAVAPVSAPVPTPPPAVPAPAPVAQPVPKPNPTPTPAPTPTPDPLSGLVSGVTGVLDGLSGK